MTVGVNHVYVVPEGTIPSVTSTGFTLNASPLQITGACELIEGVGFIGIVTVNGLPGHPPKIDVGVTVYVAV